MLRLYYWDRIWLLRRVAVPRSVWYILGSKFFSIDHLLKCYGWAHSAHTWDNSLPPASMAIDLAAWQMVIRVVDWEYLTYLHRIRSQWFPHSQCAQIIDLTIVPHFLSFYLRDRITGLIGLTQSNWKPDYITSVQDTYSRVFAEWTVEQADKCLFACPGLDLHDKSSINLQISPWVLKLASSFYVKCSWNSPYG